MRQRRPSVTASVLLVACVGAATMIFAACKQPPPAVVDAGAPAPVATHNSKTVTPTLLNCL